jgi:hypothetical protein
MTPATSAIMTTTAERMVKSATGQSSRSACSDLMWPSHHVSDITISSRLIAGSPTLHISWANLAFTCRGQGPGAMPRRHSPLRWWSSQRNDRYGSACRRPRHATSPARPPSARPRAGGRLGGEHLEGLVAVAVGRRTRYPEPGTDDLDLSPGAHPHQHQQRLTEAGQQTCPLPGATGAPARRAAARPTQARSTPGATAYEAVRRR